MINKKVYKSREEWLDERNDGFVVGGSNIGSILGIDANRTPYQLWYEFKNSGDSKITSRMIRGRFMEDSIVKWFEFETGFNIINKSSEISVFRNDRFPEYIQVSPDREMFSNGKRKRPIVEIKDTMYHIDFDNMESIPKTWYAQIQYQLGVMERDLCYLVINDGSKSLKYFPFNFDKDYFENMIDHAINWVERYILGDEIPEPKNEEDIKLLYPLSVEKSKVIGSEFKEMFYDELVIKKKAAKRIEEEIDSLSRAIKLQFGDCDTLQFEGETIATYKTNAKGIRTLKIY